jgi:SAM-dependent methyltransferase
LNIITGILRFLQRILPNSIWRFGARLNKKYLTLRYLKGKRPFVPGETTKAKPRRLKEGFFDKYCKGNGLDIGYGGDLIVPGARGWDFEHGDAQYLKGIEDESFDFVYSSHTLEHVQDAEVSLKNWYRVLKYGGYLILYIPHRDLYEKKNRLPSRFNATHLRFFLIEKEEAPDTCGIIPMLKRNLSDYEIIYAKECRYGYTITDANQHSDGEYSIEVVIKKLNLK